MTTLADREHKALTVIYTLTKSKGLPPNVRDIRSVMGFKSLSPVYHIMDSLKNKGLIHRSTYLARSIVLTDAGKKFVDPEHSGSFVPFYDRDVNGDLNSTAKTIWLPMSLARASGTLIGVQLGDEKTPPEALFLEGDTLVIGSHADGRFVVYLTADRRLKILNGNENNGLGFGLNLGAVVSVIRTV